MLIYKSIIYVIYSLILFNTASCHAYANEAIDLESCQIKTPHNNEFTSIFSKSSNSELYLKDMLDAIYYHSKLQRCSEEFTINIELDGESQAIRKEFLFHSLRENEKNKFFIFITENTNFSEKAYVFTQANGEIFLHIVDIEKIYGIFHNQ